MGVEGGVPYNPEEAIRNIIKNGTPPNIEEGGTYGLCIEEAPEPYTGDADFEPFLEPTFDENGKQDGWDIPEDDDPDNLCPTQEELENAYN